MAPAFEVPIRGIGKPDYSKEVSSGQVRAGLRLKYGESLKIGLLTFLTAASPFPYFVDPLAAGASQTIINGETGDTSGFTVPVGYYGVIVALIVKPSQDVSAWILFDGENCGCLWQVGSGNTHYENEVVPLSTGMLDPLAAAEHNLNFFITNEGGGDLYGGCTVVVLLEKVGSKPLPTVKEITCKHCGHKQTVSIEITQVVCPKCGGLTIYYSMAKYGGRG